MNWAKGSKEAGESSVEIKNGDWIMSIMEERPIAYSNKQIIAQVPKELREKEENKGLFDPRVVSIGPYHHGKPELKQAELLKARVAHTFIADSKRDPHEFYNKILQVVSDARNCYLHDDSIDAYDDEAFAHMMLLDGCFILQLIIAVSLHQSFLMGLRNHVGTAGFRAILIDIILLENQLPFLVLQELISTRFAEEEEGKGEQLIENFIVRQYIDKSATWREQTYKHEREQPFHLLQLLRRRFLGSHSDHLTEKVSSSSSPNHQDDQLCRRRSFKTILSSCCSGSRGDGETKLKDPTKDAYSAYSYSFRSATELKARGIHFRPSATFFVNDITFTSRFGYGLLTLPHLPFGLGTKYRLLNMMAYELAPSTHHIDFRVCNYIYFMNSLINGAEDVIELRSHNIIHNFYGTDEQLAKAFNSMATAAVNFLHQGPLEDVSKRLQEHYNSKMKTWTAQLLHNYFTTPWSVVAFFAATFALVLTVLQTYFQLYPRSSN